MKSGGSSSGLLQVRIEGQEELMRQSSTNAAWRNRAGNFPSLCEIMCLKKSNAPLVGYRHRFYWVVLFIAHLSIITFVLNTNKMYVCIVLCLVKQKTVVKYSALRWWLGVSSTMGTFISQELIFNKNNFFFLFYEHIKVKDVGMYTIIHKFGVGKIFVKIFLILEKISVSNKCCSF